MTHTLAITDLPLPALLLSEDAVVVAANAAAREGMPVLSRVGADLTEVLPAMQRGKVVQLDPVDDPAKAHLQPAASGGWVVLLTPTNDDAAAEAGRLRRLIDRLPVLVAVSATDSRAVDVSLQWSKTLGYSAEELMSVDEHGRQLANTLLHPEDQIVAARLLQGAVDSPGKSVTGDLRLRHRDGHYLTVRSESVYDAEAEQLYNIGVDITAQAEDEQRSELFRTLIEHATDMVVILDSQHRIEWANDAWRRSIVGDDTPLRDLIGRPVTEVVGSSDEHASCAALFGAAAKTGKARAMVELLDGSGKPLPVDCTMLQLGDGDTQPVRYANIARCARESRAREASLRAETEAVSRSAAEKDSLAQSLRVVMETVGRELRTPLNDMLGLADLLHAHSRGGELVAGLRQAGRTVVRVLDTLRDLSEVEAGQIVLDPQPTALKPLLEGLCAASPTPVSLELADDLPVAITTDPSRLRQALGHVLSASRALSEGQPVRLGARWRDSELVVYTQDAGMGLSPADQHDLLEPFHQPSDTSLLGAASLGLPLARLLVEELGGRLFFESIEGHGTTFWLVLPTKAGLEADSESVAPREGQSLEGLEVLLVEDNLVNQKVATLMLQQMGCVVTVAGDGQAATALLEHAEFDVILMDLQMPRMDGYAATRWIRRHEGPSRHTPILAVTANAMPADRTRCKAVGMDDHLPKPVELERLREALKRWDPRVGRLRVVANG